MCAFVRFSALVSGRILPSRMLKNVLAGMSGKQQEQHAARKQSSQGKHLRMIPRPVLERKNGSALMSGHFRSRKAFAITAPLVSCTAPLIWPIAVCACVARVIPKHRDERGSDLRAKLSQDCSLSHRQAVEKSIESTTPHAEEPQLCAVYWRHQSGDG